MPRDSVTQSNHNAQSRTGICSVCRGLHRLYGGNGLVYRHGPHANPCGGSGQPQWIMPTDQVDDARALDSADMGQARGDGPADVTHDHPQTVITLLMGHCPPDIGKLLFGGKLIALNKKDGASWRDSSHSRRILLETVGSQVCQFIRHG